MPGLNNTVSASTTDQTIHAFAMNGASMNWACLVARICCLFVAFQGFVGATNSDNSKKYQPSLLEGRISRKRVAFDRLYASRLVEYHDGYLIQLAYNQPLFVHFDNKREPLDKVAAGVLNDFVSMKCDFPTLHSIVVPLGRNDNEFQFLDVNRGRDFNTSSDDYGKKSKIEKNDTSFPAYLGSQTNDQVYYCFQCYHHKKYCNYCHYSPENSYYNVYYSAYYADYFSDYYGKYYTLALDNLKSTWCRSNKCTPKQL